MRCFAMIKRVYYYIKFLNKNNWLSGSLGNCDKSELFLGKQVLNNPSTIRNILTDLKNAVNKSMHGQKIL